MIQDKSRIAIRSIRTIFATPQVPFLISIDLTSPIVHAVVHIHANTTIHDGVVPLKSALDDGLVLVSSNLVLGLIDAVVFLS